MYTLFKNSPTVFYTMSGFKSIKLQIQVFWIQYCNMIFNLVMIFLLQREGKRKKLRRKLKFSRDQSDSVGHIFLRIYCQPNVTRS